MWSNCEATVACSEMLTHKLCRQFDALKGKLLGVLREFKIELPCKTDARMDGQQSGTKAERLSVRLMPMNGAFYASSQLSRVCSKSPQHSAEFFCWRGRHAFPGGGGISSDQRSGFSR